MIVEDEPLIRAGLKQYFDWRQLGVDEIVEAENGLEGIGVALRERPDLVLTDIRMPELGGLEMIERLRPELPDARFVILTGYNDFAYAQQAIRLGRISAYLLKPLQYEESLAAIKESLEGLAADRRAREARSRQAAAHAALQDGLLVKALLDGDDARAEERMRGMNAGAPCAYRPLVLAYIPDIDAPAGIRWREQAEATATAAVSALYPGCPGLQTLFYYRKRMIYALAIVPGVPGEAAAADDAAEEAQGGQAMRDARVAAAANDADVARGGQAMRVANDADVARGGQAMRDARVAAVPNDAEESRVEHAMRAAAADLAPCFYLAAGAPAPALSDAASGWRQAEKLLFGRFFDPDRRFFVQVAEPGAGPRTAHAHGLEPKDKSMLAACLGHERSDPEETRRWLLDLGRRSVSAGTPLAPEPWLAFIQEIVGECLRFAYKHGIQVEEMYSDSLLDLSFVADFRDAEGLFGWLADWIVQLGAVYRARTSRAAPQESLIFEQIEAFVTQRLHEDVTLQMVADRFYYNPSYLSRLFKSKLNQNYLAFVTDIRVRHAKRYLENPKLLVTEVCAMCGYKSYKHFVKTFRSLAGMSPTEYRKQMGM